LCPVHGRERFRCGRGCESRREEFDYWGEALEDYLNARYPKVMQEELL